MYVNNHVVLSGTVLGAPVLSHTLYGENFYVITLSVPRLSSSCDELPITVHEKFIAEHNIAPGMELGIEGQLRSYNKLVEGQSKLVITVFARELFFDRREGCPNQIILRGALCKPPVYRTTPFGREIADLLLAVGRAYGKSDYIPCIAWGRNARYAKDLNVGQRLELTGRVQSRIYQKRISEDEVLEKTAYEVSISGVQAENLPETFT